MFVTRYSDINPDGSVAKGPQLPAIDWQRINQTAPVRLPIDRRLPNDPLPAADIAIVTWTSAEWSAMDHVFGGSDDGTGRAIDDWSWKQNWFPYTRGAAGFTSDPKSGALWARSDWCRSRIGRSGLGGCCCSSRIRISLIRPGSMV